MDSTVEVWKPVVRFEGHYEVSSQGRIRSVDRETLCQDGKTYAFQGVMRKPQRSRNGYLYLKLTKPGAFVHAYIHRAVLEAFVGPCPEGMEACHNDGDQTNNHLSNLRWDTHEENMKDRVRHGTASKSRAKRPRRGPTGIAREKRTRCPRGHYLAGENLKPASLKRGQRTCLACDRAMKYMGRYPGDHKSLKEVSDRYYADIVKR